MKAKEGNLARAAANGYHKAVEVELRRLGEERRALEERLLGAEAEPGVTGVELIPMGDDEALGESVRSLVPPIIIDAPARSFTVETLTASFSHIVRTAESASSPSRCR